MNRLSFTMAAVFAISLFTTCKSPGHHGDETDTDSNDAIHQKILQADNLLPQHMDSVRLILQSLNEVENDDNTAHKAYYYNTYGNYYWYSSQPLDAIGMYKKTLLLNLPEKSQGKKAQAANNIGSLYNSLGAQDSARKYLQTALEIDIILENEKGIMKTNFDLGVFFSRNDKYELALKHLTQSHDYYKKTNMEHYLLYVENALGNVYYKLDSVDIANHYYRNAARLAKKLGNKELEALSYSNITAIYSRTIQGFDSTKYYSRLGLNLARELEDSLLMLTLHSNIGSSFNTMKQNDSAYIYFKKAETFITPNSSPLLVVLLHLYLGDAYHTKQNLRESEEYYLKGYELARKIESLSNQKDALLGLVSIDSIHKNYEAAFLRLREAMHLQHTILNKETSTQIARFQIMYETEKKQNTIDKLEARNKFNGWLIFAIILFTLMAVTILLLTALNLKKRHKLSESLLELKKIEAERLKVHLDANRQELKGKVLSLVKADELIEKLKKDIQFLVDKNPNSNKEELTTGLKKIYSEESSKMLWDEFEARFNELNNGFISRLINRFPNLSPAEIRMCAMLHLQLSSKEIAELINRSSRTIDYTRNNIRKKMGLSPNDNLTAHILSI